MTLTHDEFNAEVKALIVNVVSAANCLGTDWSIRTTMASADRLRSVVDATLPLRESAHSSFTLEAKIERAPIIGPSHLAS